MSLIDCQLRLTLVALCLTCYQLSVVAAEHQHQPLPNSIPITASTLAANIENDVLRLSYELEQWIDADKRPCQDFFGYVCARSLNTTHALNEQQLQQEQQRFDRFLATNDDEQLMDMELKLKQFYDSCKHARSVDELKTTLMYRMSGGWPAIDDTMGMQRKRRNMTWLSVLSSFHDIGVTYFFEAHIEIRSNKRVVLLQPDTTMHYTLRKFEQLAGEVMLEYAVDAGRARLVALEILSFERNRREIIKAIGNDELIEISYAELKMTQLFGSTLQLDWDAYFRKILGKPLKPTDTVLIRQRTQFIQLFELLHNTTMNRILNWLWIDYLMDKSSADCQLLVANYFGPVYQHIVERVAVDKVQMAQLYASLGNAYEGLMPTTVWIDEMSQQNSKQFLGRIIHLTLNGDAKLDADYQELTVTKRNFYRNLEKTQRFVAQQRKRPQLNSSGGGSDIGASSGTHNVMQSANDYMKVFLTVNALLQAQNLTTPLNYMLVGAQFAEHMIAGGSSTSTPGAWRSMDSDREFANLQHCNARQTTNSIKYNVNDLLLKMLAQQQTLHAYEQWLAQDKRLQQRLDTLLAAGRLQLSLRKLYFIASVLVDCRRHRQQHTDKEQQQQLIHNYLRNTVQFSQTFGCRASDELYSRSTCKVI